MKTKSNKKWSLIIAFILMFLLFSFISFKLFSVQYSIHQLPLHIIQNSEQLRPQEEISFRKMEGYYQ